MSARITIVGGGITGLTTAYRFSKLMPGAQITLIEAGDHVGGKIRSSPFAGIAGVDEGADALIRRVPYALDLAAAAGLGDQPVTGIAYDAKTGRLYASTDFGVAVLPRNRQLWLPSAAGRLPPVAVYGLTLDNRTRLLYAATHGRGVWRLELSDDD